ncbi:concanavalin A-like lectin/glucanase [Trichodelitschia bisporula]|uniref:Concanavalin A-like lectin/glucanase n=1 Tax=Trichodelitschia bisporula TaxID=703511 RepID=A0A6G1I2A4_9PEZI|nr:concanavalin A-like lectin/glucanase [Trichodelitschia bisporula]
MYIPRTPFGLLVLASVARLVAGKSYGHEPVVDDLSFGHHEAIWSPDHHHVPGWTLLGEGYTPEVLSDRIILTPPYPGNKRGAIWADHAETETEWHAEMEFRASGPDHGTGNMQLWFAKDGKKVVGTSSLYTVAAFDGLVLVVSQYGGHGGTLRAFLNDGSVSFKDHHHVDQLAFASCDFSYRNLGRFSHLSVKQDYASFEVEIDHKPCFKTGRIHLPAGYYFGITAASAENPDSFETKSLLVSKIDTHHHEEHNWQKEAQQVLHEQDHAAKDDAGEGWHWTTEEEHIKDAPASSYKTEADKFQDLHSRLTVMGHQLDTLYHDLTLLKSQYEARHEELMTWIRPVHDHADASRRAVERVEHAVEAIKRDVEGKDYREHLTQLHDAIKEGHQAMLVGVPHTVHSLVQASSPRMGFFVFIVLAFQVMLLASYVVYRRRRDSAPKKYL